MAKQIGKLRDKRNYPDPAYLEQLGKITLTHSEFEANIIALFFYHLDRQHVPKKAIAKNL